VDKTLHACLKEALEALFSFHEEHVRTCGHLEQWMSHCHGTLQKDSTTTMSASVAAFAIADQLICHHALCCWQQKGFDTCDVVLCELWHRSGASSPMICVVLLWKSASCL